MTDIITLTGLVATVPEYRRVRGGELAIATFRLASNQRHFERSTQTWVTGETNWYTVSAFRNLATNVQESIHKGDRVVVIGKLKIQTWDIGEKKGTNVEVDADNIGQDLAWGTAKYTRTPARDSASADPSGRDYPAETERYEADPNRGESEQIVTDPDVPQEQWSAATPGDPDGLEDMSEENIVIRDREVFPAIP
jgi:single-strand DNA-binding protein